MFVNYFVYCLFCSFDISINRHSDKSVFRYLDTRFSKRAQSYCFFLRYANIFYFLLCKYYNLPFYFHAFYVGLVVLAETTCRAALSSFHVRTFVTACRPSSLYHVFAQGHKRRRSARHTLNAGVTKAGQPRANRIPLLYYTRSVLP